ncbi:MAG: helix-turn-helix transcriptional regulator [Lachnospiraceae bacterium]|nr:helix-turn-helix transcriptional regulator [Lachnospiraceae bacterium]
MAKKKEYEEKQQHGTAELPVGLHKMSYPAGTDVIFYLHWHQEFEILVVTEGQIEFAIEDRQYLLQEGEGVFINSNLLHSAKAVGGKPCSFFAVDFHYQFLHEDIHSRFARKYLKPVLDGKVVFPEFLSVRQPQQLGRPEFLNPKNKRRHMEEQRNQDDSLPGVWQEKILKLIQELRICPEHDAESYELMLRSYIFGIWDVLERQSIRIHRGTEEETKASGRLEPVVRYMKENYAYEMTLAELAELIPMSEGQFCRVFKQNMKMSPMQYLMRYRILQSCRLLLDTDKKIGEIANLSGFNNISYFNKVFLQTIGCTPKEYRANSNY